MSRGGRGGWGGGGRNDAGKMGGQALPWEYDPELEGKLNTKPSEKFPPIQPPVADPPSASERRVVHHYRTLRARIHDGPFYAILDSNARVHKSGRRSPAQAHYDPFEGMPTYSQRYMKKQNTLPRLSTRPFVKDFFPQELWAIIAPNDQVNVKKSLHLSTRTRLDKFNMANMYDEDDPDRPDADDVEENKEDEENVEDKDDEDKDPDEDPDQFDEDDEDDNDDYNAEQYFDGGDDDDFGDEGGGGDEDF